MTIRVAALQMSSGADLPANLDTAQTLLREAADRGARLAVLPENFAFMGLHERDKLEHAEVDGAGKIQDLIAETARALGVWVVAGTLPLSVPSDPGRVHAASLVFDDQGRRVARYDKIHLFDVEIPATASASAEVYRESASIATGNPSAVVVPSVAGEVGLSVCYDLRFPELYRALVQRGAQWLSVPSAFTWKTGQAHWELLLRARAVENQCYVVAPNQCGEHPGGRRTWGHSMIVDPWGTIVAQADEAIGVVLADVDLERLSDLRKRFPVLHHRRLS